MLTAGAGLALDRLFPPPMARAQNMGATILDRQARTLAVLPATGGIWRLPVSVRDVPPTLTALLVAAEDRRFYQHPGIDPLAVIRAAGQWVKAGHVVSGGSTLTMQVARLLEPRPRTLRAKAVEAFRALQLEARYSKDEILGLWLSLAPQGGNLEGVRAGALAWFGKSPAALDPAEAAFLVALARRPEALRPDRHPLEARAARDALLTRRAMGAAGMTDTDRRIALETPVPGARRGMPGLAPHLARQWAEQGKTLSLTIDLPLQRAVEGLADEARRGLHARASVAIIVAEIDGRAVRAMTGGAWGNEARAGAIDLTRAIRSPGSALKPWLYGMAFEAGLASPEMVLNDRPLRYGGYAPENFDRGFTGQVTAAEALRRSLNLPAVALLDRLGPLTFASGLKAGGAPTHLPVGADPALPLALGGVGTSLRDLVTLYATLASGGRMVPLRYLEAAAPSPPRQAMAPRAAASVAAILTRGFPTGGPQGVAWKTGTSWGGRDAWAIGFDGAHVIGVWVGRPDGTPMPGATGQDTALPILARAFSLLPLAPRTGMVAAVKPDLNRSGTLDRLRLLFPPQGAELASGQGPVTLRVAGGQRPLTFLMDGAPLPSQAARREASWTPPGPGFYRLTVLDAQGAATRAIVRVRD